MLFNSFTFLIFFPVVATIYFVLPQQASATAGFRVVWPSR